MSQKEEGAKCKLVVTSGRKLLFKTSIKAHLTQIDSDAIHQHTGATVTAAVMDVARSQRLNHT